MPSNMVDLSLRTPIATKAPSPVLPSEYQRSYLTQGMMR